MSDLLPPWTVFHRGDGTADILPSGRPGTVVENLPLKLAERLVAAAGEWMRLEIPQPKQVDCNRHVNCADADAKAAAEGRRTDHCHDEGCEECFGN